MSPWNYPFLLTIDPLADAIAAGNTAIVKPSAYSPATSKIIEKIINECFAPEYVAIVTGGRAENAALLEQNFDFVFFTGSQAVGKEVLRHTAEHLTPAVLELGGKSPCIVDESANIKLAARRIVFGKYLNYGQTCVAPDYVLCESSVKDKFIDEVVKQIKNQYGDNPLENKDYGKIINEKHFERLCGLIDEKKVVEFLKNHPQVEKVNHPSLPEHPDNTLYQKYFPNGGGSIFTFEVKGGQEEAHKFIDNLKIFSLLANVADAKSLVIHPATTTHSQLTEEELADQGIKPNTIRLSIGTEHIDDIIADLQNGFKVIKEG